MLDGLDLDVVDLDHLVVDAQDGHDETDDGVAVLGLLILEFDRIAELQVLLVTFEGSLLSRFLHLRNKEQTWHLLHSNRIKRSAIQRQVVVFGSEVHDEIALDIVGPLMHTMPLRFEGEGARITVQLQALRVVVHDLRDELSGFGLCRCNVIGDLLRDKKSVGGQR